MTDYSKQKLKPLQVLTKPKQKTLPLWATILLDLGLSGIQFLIETVASFFLSPVVMVFVRAVGDVGVNLLVDYISGYNPFQAENLITSILLPSLQLPSKLKSVSKINRSGLNNMTRILIDRNKKNDVQWLKKMNKDLFELSNVYNQQAGRKYQIIVNKYNALDKLNYFNNTPALQLKGDYLKALIVDKKSMQLANKVNAGLRKINRYISFVDPSYAARELIKTILKPYSVKWNKALKKLYSGVDKVLQSKFRKVAKKLAIIYFSSEWILGIKLISIPGVLNYFHVKVFFDPEKTNNKQPITLYKVSFNKVIVPWLNSESKGQFYINNICWGWDVGKAIRSAKLSGVGRTILMLDRIAIFNKYLSTAISISRNIQFLTKKVKDVANGKYFGENFGKNLLLGVSRGISSSFKLPGATITSAIIKTAQSGNSIYLQRYGANKARSIMRKKRKNVSKNIINKSIKSGKLTGRGIWT